MRTGCAYPFSKSKRGTRIENYVILGMVSYAADVKTVPPRKKDVRGTDKRYTDSILLTRSAIGVLTVSPAESAVIAADIAIKSSGADIGFVDRFTGTLIISGSVSSVESAFCAIREYVINKLGYTCCEITRT